ncbi:hypothetical protein [Chryseobacterium pennipullorum]|uniref:DUF4252 domain-containing protein n=1 Tax=Chryseobacterium pennipullorum TaxID=2258963 RepID=A0A3D9B1X3_9FLAO|nr:hypothetical protein [Chryseobacterium pennipullorum]REC47246.1 hypothetical protein DRF67_11535 [Chryseobacterium pennipullorum]
MKKIVILSIVLSLSSISTAKAQSFLDKIDRAVDKVDRASNTADRASNTGRKLSSLFGKKNKKNTSKTNEIETMTIIRISNIDLTSLKKIDGIISGTSGVTDTDMKYNANESIITVMHTGSSEMLLENIQPKAKSIFTDKNVESFDEGSIEIKIK